MTMFYTGIEYVRGDFDGLDAPHDLYRHHEHGLVVRIPMTTESPYEQDVHNLANRHYLEANEYVDLFKLVDIHGDYYARVELLGDPDDSDELVELDYMLSNLHGYPVFDDEIVSELEMHYVLEYVEDELHLVDREELNAGEICSTLLSHGYDYYLEPGLTPVFTSPNGGEPVFDIYDIVAEYDRLIAL